MGKFQFDSLNTNKYKSVKKWQNRGKDLGSAIGDLLEGLANYVGLGGQVRRGAKYLLKANGVIDLDAVKNQIRKVITYALTAEDLNLAKIQDKLDQLQVLFPNSNLKNFINDQKAQLKNKLNQGKIKAAKVEAGLSGVESKLNELDNLSTGQIAHESVSRVQDIKDDINAALSDSNSNSTYEQIEERLK